MLKTRCSRRTRAQVNAGNPGDFYCWTALHKAAYSGAVEAVGEVLAAGADIEARDTWNKTALLLAAEMGGHRTCALLLERGADVNARNKNNMTALHYAARYPTLNPLTPPPHTHTPLRRLVPYSEPPQPPSTHTHSTLPPGTLL